MAIPVATRRKMLDAIERGESVARRFEVTEQGLRQIRRLARERGTLEPAKNGPKGHFKLTDADVQLMRQQIQINPGITLIQLRDMLSVHVAESTVCRALKKMNLSLKKKSLIAAEQHRPDIIERRRNFAIARRFVAPGSFVFLDESGVTSNMTRLYGRSPVGERCVDHTPHGHWKTTTLLSAMRLAGVIESATVIYDGPINRVTFEGYVEQYPRHVVERSRQINQPFEV